MKSLIVFLALNFCALAASSQTKLTIGEQPQLTFINGNIRVVFGKDDQIWFAESRDNGKTFTAPTSVARVPGMHLGMTRGPQIASSTDYTMVTAMDKAGNILAFRLSHRTNKWSSLGRVNDVDGSAPEGLMSIDADDNNRFYAVWLDLRNERKNNICFSVFDGARWSKNIFAYKSPEDHVCECCKPSIDVKGKQIAIMFRNWLKGSRDLYLVTSSDRGLSFGAASKLGSGSWPLKGCPMDGGGISINSQNKIQTAWQREGNVFVAEPGKPEEKIGKGRHVGLVEDIAYWEEGDSLMLQRLHAPARTIGKGTALSIIPVDKDRILAVWQDGGELVYQTLNLSISSE